jgi:hypothetical protein
VNHPSLLFRGQQPCWPFLFARAGCSIRNFAAGGGQHQVPLDFPLGSARGFGKTGRLSIPLASLRLGRDDKVVEVGHPPRNPRFRKPRKWVSRPARMFLDPG